MPKRTFTVIGDQGQKYKATTIIPDPTAYSAASRPPIPMEVGHPFRSKSATYSD